MSPFSEAYNTRVVLDPMSAHPARLRAGRTSRRGETLRANRPDGRGYLGARGGRGERASDIESGRYLAWLYGQADHSGNHWLRVRLIGRGGNRDAIGARVTLDGKFREMRSGGSYLSHNDTRLGFGPGSAETASHLEGRWPGGKSESFESIKNVGADKTLTLVEGLGIVSISP